MSDGRPNCPQGLCARRINCPAGEVGPVFNRPLEGSVNRILVLAIAALVAGCSSVTGNDDDEVVDERVIGLLVTQEHDPQIVAPDTVNVGETFEVSIRTYGLSSCWEMDGTEVHADGLAATVIPFDVHLAQRVIGCRAVVREFEHVATLGFDRPGSAVLTVHGRNDGASGPATYTREIVVR